MATFYPSIHYIEQMIDKSTYGELKLIYFLRDYLTDQPDFEGNWLDDAVEKILKNK